MDGVCMSYGLENNRNTSICGAGLQSSISLSSHISLMQVLGLTQHMDRHVELSEKSGVSKNRLDMRLDTDFELDRVIQTVPAADPNHCA